MARQALAPGHGYINEDTSNTALVPGKVYLNAVNVPKGFASWSKKNINLPPPHYRKQRLMPY